MISGGVYWILDRVCFTKVVNFHVLWHLLSTIGVYSGTQIYHEHRKILTKLLIKYYNGTKIIIKVYEYKGNSVSVHCFHLLSFYVNSILNMNYGIQ